MCLPAYVFVHYMCAGPVEIRRECWSSGTGVIDSYELWVLGIEPASFGIAAQCS